MPVPQDTQQCMPNPSKASILLQQKQQAASQDTSPEQLRELAYTSKRLMLRVAENNAAPPELLRELAVSSKAVCERVAANPNTPTDVLFKLGATTSINQKLSFRVLVRKICYSSKPQHPQTHPK